MNPLANTTLQPALPFAGPGSHLELLARGGDREAAARRVADEFESFFLARFIDEMQAGIATDGPFSGGPGEAMFRGLLSDEYGKHVTKSGGVGIADAVYREILKLQEASEA